MQVWTNKDRNGKVDSYDYDILINDKNIGLYYSNNTEWTNPGDHIATLNDDGNTVKISVGKKKMKLEYNEVVELLSLLLFHHKDSIELRESQIIKSI